MLCGGGLYKLDAIEAQNIAFAFKVYAQELKKREVANIFRTAKEEQQREETIFKKTCEEASKGKPESIVQWHTHPLPKGHFSQFWVGQNQKRENEGK
jgi:hypothetical protein